MKELLEQQGLAAALEELPAATIVAYDNVIQKRITILLSDEDQALLLLTSLSSSYDNFMETLLYGRDSLKLEDVLATLNSRELQKMTGAKGDGGEGLYVRGKSGQRDMKQGTYNAWSKYNHKKSQGFVRNEDQVSGSRADGYDNADVMMVMSVEELYVPELRQNLISLGTLEKKGFIVKMQSGKIKVIKGSLVVLSGTRRANCVYTLDGQAETRKTLKEVYTTMYEEWGRQTFGCCRETTAEWVEDTTRSTYLVNRSPSSAIGFKKPIDMLGFFGWLAGIKQGMLEPVKVKCVFLGYHKSIVGNKLWRLDDVTSKVLQGVEFEVEPPEDHTFEVEPHVNFDHVVGSQMKIWMLGQMCMCSTTVAGNVVTTAMDITESIHQATKGLLVKAKGNVLGMEIIRNQSGNTLRVSQSRFYNEKLVQTLLEGHYILSLESSLSRDCDAEKNGKWSCIYAVGSHEYQVVCTRFDIASADVSMLDKFDHGLQTDVQEAKFQDMWALSTIEAEYVTLTKTVKEAIWLKRLSTESETELKLVAVVATGAFTKAGPWSEIPT
ncbi:hypothetical protein Tco_0228887, partial [Tanacetum coccineum]